MIVNESQADDSSEQFVLLNQLADAFAARYRRGERPSLQEYIDRHPELADDIRAFFPALAEMEQVKDGRQEVQAAPGPRPPPAAGGLEGCRATPRCGQRGLARDVARRAA